MRMRLVVASAIVVLLVASVQSTAGSSATTATPIKHLVVIVQENHTFDNYFGTYPTANGTLVNPATSQLHTVDGIPRHVCMPAAGTCLAPRLEVGSSPLNPVEGPSAYEGDYRNNGTGFVTSSGPQSMVYFDYHAIPAYWDYAEEYGLGDNYFASLLSTTTPNRLMLLTGNTSVSHNYGPPPYLPYSSTVMSQLDAAGVTWGYYDFGASGGPMSVYPMNYFSNVEPSSLANIRNVSEFFVELASGNGLPSVSFVNFLGKPGLTEHPPFNVTEGERQVVSVVNGVMGSSYWNSTAILITWDEGGGFYDHVVPPTEFSLDHGFSERLTGFGQRVPFLVVSPYSKEDYVSNRLLSHLSVLHLIEYNWRLPALNSLVSSSNLPLDFFDFGQQPRGPISLTEGGQSSADIYPIPLQPVSGAAAHVQQESAGPPYGLVTTFGLAAAAVVTAITVVALTRRHAAAS